MVSNIPDIFKNSIEEIYNITEGNIILCGSLALKLRGIIDREINDFDLNINEKDWIRYKSKLYKKFKFYPGLRLNYGWFVVDTYTVVDTNNIQFHMFVNIIEQAYDTVLIENIKCNLLKPELILKHKQIMLDEEPFLEKHITDITQIKSYLNEN